MNPGGDFLHLLQEGGLLPKPVERTIAVEPSQPVLQVHGTTVLALKYDHGILNVGDRRATSENMVIFDHADKIVPLDDYTLLAISGSYAKAMEVVRYLQHAFKYYRRSQLQEISIEGKVNEVSRAIAANLPNALQGLGAFLPILSTFDEKSGAGQIFFYDGMGAKFDSGDFGAAGSGSFRIRGIFDYISKTKGPFHERPLAEVLGDALVMLDIAADLDAFTGGYAKVLPVAKTVSAAGIEVLSEEQLREAVARLGK